MPLHGPWTDSTGTGFTYPNAYVVSHERIDTIKQVVLIDVKVWASSGTYAAQNHPLYEKTLSPTANQITNIVTFIEGAGDTAVKGMGGFGGMSTTA